MHKKLTITIEENLYNNLYSLIGKGKISKFIENAIKPYIDEEYLKLGYQEMAKDKEREQEAEEWTEGLIADFANFSSDRDDNS